MARHRVMIGCCVLTFGLVSASGAYSDPLTVEATVVITSGSVTVAEGMTGPAVIYLNGAGFSLAGSPADSIFVGPRSCFPCEEGAPIPTGTTAASPVAGTVTYMGQTWPLETGSAADSVYLQFMAPTLTAPPVSEVAGSLLALTAPFTFIGSVNVNDQSGRREFRADLSGRGIVELQLEAFQIPGFSYWQYKGVSYRFTDAAEPVPEPASLLLLAGGLAEVVRRRSRRTRV